MSAACFMSALPSLTVSSGESPVAVPRLPASSVPRPEGGTNEVLYIHWLNKIPVGFQRKITKKKASGQQPSIFQKDPHALLSVHLGTLTNEQTPGRENKDTALSPVVRESGQSPGQHGSSEWCFLMHGGHEICHCQVD